MKERNKFELELGDQKYVLRCTFDFLMTVEERLKKSFTELAMDSESGKITYGQCIVLIEEGLKANDAKYDIDDIKKAVVKIGLVPMTLKIQELLLIAAYGGEAMELLKSDLESEDNTKKK